MDNRQTFSFSLTIDHYKNRFNLQEFEKKLIQTVDDHQPLKILELNIEGDGCTFEDSQKPSHTADYRATSSIVGTLSATPGATVEDIKELLHKFVQTLEYKESDIDVREVEVKRARKQLALFNGVRSESPFTDLAYSPPSSGQYR